MINKINHNILILTFVGLCTLKAITDKKKIKNFYSVLQVEKKDTVLVNTLNRFNVFRKNRIYIITNLIELKKNSTLIINEGCIIKFVKNSGIIIRSGSNFKMNSTKKKPIILTTFNDNYKNLNNIWKLDMHISNSLNLNFIQIKGGIVNFYFEEYGKKNLFSFLSKKKEFDSEIELYLTNCLIENSHFLLKNENSNDKKINFNFVETRIIFSEFLLNNYKVSFTNAIKNQKDYCLELYFSNCYLKSSKFKSDKIILENTLNILSTFLSNDIIINNTISQNIIIPIISNVMLDNVKLINPELDKNILMLESRKVKTNNIYMKSKGITFDETLNIDYLEINLGDEIQITGHSEYNKIKVLQRSGEDTIIFVGNSNIKPKIIINSIEGDNIDLKYLSLKFINLNIEINTKLDLNKIELENSTILISENCFFKTVIFKTLYQNNSLIFKKKIVSGKFFIYIDTKNPSYNRKNPYYPMIDLNLWPLISSKESAFFSTSLNIFLGDFYKYKIWSKNGEFDFDECNVFFWGKMFVDGEDRITNIPKKCFLFPYGDQKMINYLEYI